MPSPDRRGSTRRFSRRESTPQKTGTEFIVDGTEEEVQDVPQEGEAPSLVGRRGSLFVKADAFISKAIGSDKETQYSPEELNKMYRPSKYVIDPRRSKLMPMWDIVMLVALLFTCIFTPYEVTFIDEGACITVIFFINRFIDLLFCTDICLIFNLAYQESESGGWVYSRSLIACNYFKGFFLIDIFSVLPFYIFTFLLAEPNVQCSPFTGQIRNFTMLDKPDDLARAASVVKVIKLLRMLKLARVMKASRVLKRIVEDVLMSKMELTYASLTVLKLFCGLIVLAHLQACVWALVPYFLTDIPAGVVATVPQTWVEQFIRDRGEHTTTRASACAARAPSLRASLRPHSNTTPSTFSLLLLAFASPQLRLG